MKIAVFTKKTTFHEGYGGLETQNKVLCEGLCSRGHDITVFSPRWELTLDEANEGGIKYVFVDCIYRMGPVLGFFGTWQKSNWINRSVEEFVGEHRKEKFDLLLAQSSAGLGVIRQKERLGIKVISISHGTIIGEFKTFLSTVKIPRDSVAILRNAGFTIKNFFRRQREFVHGSNKIIAVSNFVRRALLEETFALEDKVVVVNNGMDTNDFFAENKKITRGKKLLYVGQIIKSKGIEDIMEMMSSPEFSSVQIDIAGAGEMLGECKSRVSHDEKLSKLIKFVGKVPHGELIRKYFLNKEYGMLVFPTKRLEGFPMVLAESMFSGLPIVAYGMGGVEDAVKDGLNGYLVPADDLEAFKKKVLTIINDDDLRSELGRSALRFAYDNLTLDNMIDKYENVIRKVLS